VGFCETTGCLNVGNVFKSRCSGLWRRVVLWYDTGFSEVYAASIFRMNEDGSSKDLRNVGILAQHCTAPQPRTPRFEISPPWTSENSQRECIDWL